MKWWWDRINQMPKCNTCLHLKTTLINKAMPDKVHIRELIPRMYKIKLILVDNKIFSKYWQTVTTMSAIIKVLDFKKWMQSRLKQTWIFRCIFLYNKIRTIWWCKIKIRPKMLNPSYHLNSSKKSIMIKMSDESQTFANIMNAPTLLIVWCTRN